MVISAQIGICDFESTSHFSGTMYCSTLGGFFTCHAVSVGMLRLFENGIRVGAMSKKRYRRAELGFSSKCPVLYFDFLLRFWVERRNSFVKEPAGAPFMVRMFLLATF